MLINELSDFETERVFQSLKQVILKINIYKYKDFLIFLTMGISKNTIFNGEFRPVGIEP